MDDVIQPVVFTPNLDPQTDLVLEQRIAIPYTTTQPTFTPANNGTRRIYFDGTNYFLYVYANGAWRSQQLGITATTSKYGGTGSDGALTITAGATNIDLANVAIVTKNYTSISITGTSSLTFTNPNTNGTIIILKSQGNVTITSSTSPAIVASSLGSAGGSAPGSTSSGVAGNEPNRTLPTSILSGAGGKFSNTTTTVGITTPNPTISWSTQTIQGKHIILACGAGGGSGAQSGGNSVIAAGGIGGGALYIECGGALNYTAVISVAGINASNTTNTTTPTTAGGGGSGGGAAGCCVITYATLTASTGTFTTSGGNGGNSGLDQAGGESRACGGGAGGDSLFNAGGNGGNVSARAGQNGGNGGGTGGGTGGTATGNSGGAGGGGAAGWSLVVANTEFT